VGLLIAAQGNYKYAVVAVEYFIKWIEAKPLVNIASTTLKKFLWQNIICRFGVPRTITADNAKQFDCDLFKGFCYQMGIEAIIASVYHPQSNGVVERANALIFTTMKKCLGDQKKEKWAEELSKVVRNHNTYVSKETNFMSFKLLFSEEPVTLRKSDSAMQEQGGRPCTAPQKLNSKICWNQKE
jgi:transposase InsO family protein